MPGFLTKLVKLAGRSWPILGVATVALAGFSPASPFGVFERTYPTRGPTHLTLININGEMRVAAWDRREIFVRVITAPQVSVEDRIDGDSIEVKARTGWGLGRADFEVKVPHETSALLKNKVGKISMRGLSGHISVDSLQGDVRLTDIRSPSVEVKVIGGDIFFDGDFSGRGPYSFQSMRGDIDLTLPSTTSFNFDLRALKEKINLGDFQCNQCFQQPKLLSGTHLKGGPKLTLTAYDGRILLHRR